MRRIATLVVIAAVACAGAAWAQDSGPALTAATAAAAARVTAESEVRAGLTLDACVAAALANNGRRKAADQGVEQATARHGQARSSRFPTVSATLMSMRQDEDPNFIFPPSSFAVPAMTIQTPPMTLTLPANAFGPGFPPANIPLPIPGSSIPIPAQTLEVPGQDVRLMDKTVYTGSLNATYALYTGGLAGARIQQALAGIEAARHEGRQTAAELVFDVKRAYYGIVLAQKLRAVASDTLERMKATLDITESAYKSGSGRVKKTDFLRHSAMVHTIASMVAEFEAQERTARAALASLIGSSEAGGPAVADQDFPAGSDDVGRDDRVRQALEQNPQIAQVQAGLASMKAGVAAARAGHLPKVGLFADLRLIGNSYDAGIVTPQNKTAWAVGIGIDIPLFEGFRVSNEVREARAGHKKLEHQYAALRDGVAYEVNRTLVAIEKALAQRESTGLAYKAASENRDLHVRAYQDELVETKDLIESQLVEAVLAGQFFTVQYELVESRARLDLLLGATGSAKSPAPIAP